MFLHRIEGVATDKLFSLQVQISTICTCLRKKMDEKEKKWKKWEREIEVKRRKKKERNILDKRREKEEKMCRESTHVDGSSLMVISGERSRIFRMYAKNSHVSNRILHIVALLVPCPL